MSPKKSIRKKRPSYRCPECPMTFRSAAGRGSHRRSAHGVKGSSPAVIAQRKKKKAEFHAASSPEASALTEADPRESTPTPRIKRKYTRRAAIEVYQPVAKVSSPSDAFAEATLAVCVGRTQQFLIGLALEFDLAPRELTKRVLGALHG